MQWQDFVFTICQFVFAASLLPSIFGKDKPALLTSVISSTFLFVFAFTYSTLSMWLSVISSTILALLWLLLAIQKFKLNK